MNPGNATIIGLVALGDVVLGLALAAAGVVRDVLPLSIGGTVLLISGLGMLVWAMRVRGRPTTL